MDLVREFKKGFNKLRNEKLHAACFHEDDECSERIIKAHSIQNNKILNKLSHEGKVLYFDIKKVQETGVFDFKETGRKKATTFTGFCGFHDNKIFKPIEEKDYEVGNKEQEFLFAYRAMAKEYHAKKTTKNIFEYIVELIENEEIEKLKEYFPNINEVDLSKLKELSKYMLVGTNNTFETLEKTKEAMKVNLRRKRYYKIETKVIELEKECNIAVTGPFGVVRDLEGNVVNDLSNLSIKIAPLILTVLPQNGKTYILMSYSNKDRERYKFIQKQILNKSIDEQKAIISNMIVSYCENLVISPKAWDRLEENKKNRIIEIYNNSSLKVNKELILDWNLDLFF